MSTVWLDGAVVDVLDTLQRALAYGDGLFETMRVVGGRVPLWPWHLLRLQRDLPRLRLEPPSPALTQQVAEHAATLGDATLKLMVIAQPGKRGYARSGTGTHSLLIAGPAPTLAAGPLVLAPSALRLGDQPALAGIKHLNRLEQVLALADRGDADDVLLCDARGALVCAGSGNLLLVQGDSISTPRLRHCGIAGAFRDALIDQAATQGIRIRERRIGSADLAMAAAVYRCNALRGIDVVGRIGQQIFQPSPYTPQLWKLQAALGLPVPNVEL